VISTPRASAIFRAVVGRMSAPCSALITVFLDVPARRATIARVSPSRSRVPRTVSSSSLKLTSRSWSLSSFAGYHK
jgi:hypothetical protein